MDPAHLSEQAEHLLILRQHDQRERIDAVIACHLAQDGQERAPQPTPLELVHHCDRRLGHVGADDAVVTGDPDDALLARRFVRRGDQGEAVLIVDHRQAVGERIGETLQGRKEAEVHRAFRHRRHRLDQERLVLGDDRPDVDPGPVGQLQHARLETRCWHGDNKVRELSPTIPGDVGGSRRWRNLGIAAGATTAVIFAGFDLYQWMVAYASDHFHNDFTFYYAAARIGAGHGWPSIYDLGLQQSELNAMGSGIGIAALAWLPTIYALQLGQPGLFVAFGAASSYFLLRRGRQLESGLALGLIVFKPQLGFLLPIALLVGGRYRAFAGAALAIGLLALASAVNVGPGGIATYEQRLSFAAGVPVNQALTLAPYLGNLTVTRALQAAIAIWAIGLVYRFRRRSPEWMYV